MKKIDSTVLKETVYVSLVTLIFSVLMQSVYLIIGIWDYTVLSGNILGFVASCATFFLWVLLYSLLWTRIQRMQKNTMKLSQSMRLLMMFVVALVGYLVPVFNIIAVVIPFIFPRIAVALLTPINLISEVATPVSMAFRHYGNVLSGSVISVLLGTALASLSSKLLNWLPGSFEFDEQ